MKTPTESNDRIANRQQARTEYESLTYRPMDVTLKDSDLQPTPTKLQPYMRLLLDDDGSQYIGIYSDGESVHLIPTGTLNKPLASSRLVDFAVSMKRIEPKVCMPTWRDYVRMAEDDLIMIAHDLQVEFAKRDMVGAWVDENFKREWLRKHSRLSVDS